MVERSYRWLFWSLVVLGLLLDQGSKYGVFRWLYHEGTGGEWVIVPGAFRLVAQYTHEEGAGGRALDSLRTWSGARLPEVNHGALFGMLREYVTLANVLFAVVSVIAAIAITYWSTRRTTARDRFLCAALGLILAGTLGNLYDRLVFNGVRDFLHFYYINWPVFNVADCCLVVGAFMLLAQAFLNQPATEPRKAGEVVLSTATGEVK
jgi:lipoprotein signal peptidase